MGASKNYDASQVTLSFMGIPITSGFADGEFLTIEQSSEDFTMVVGTDGQVTRCATNDRSATIKIKLLQSSDGNAQLSTINNLDKLTKNGFGIGAMMVRDRLGTAVFTASRCWISKPPDVSFDKTATAREWTLQCADLVRFDGGN